MIKTLMEISFCGLKNTEDSTFRHLYLRCVLPAPCPECPGCDSCGNYGQHATAACRAGVGMQN